MRYMTIAVSDSDYRHALAHIAAGRPGRALVGVEAVIDVAYPADDRPFSPERCATELSEMNDYE